MRGLIVRDAPGSLLAASTAWWDTTFDRRLRVTLTNPSASSVFDALVDLPLQSQAATVNAASLRAVEVTTEGTVDRAFDWRYAPGTTSPNRFWSLPVVLIGSVVTVKLLGAWSAGETRTIDLYWDSTAAVAAADYHHLSGIAQGWVGTFLAGTAGDTYQLIVGGQTYTYAMVGGNTATVIAQAVKALINAGTVAVATGGAAALTITATNANDPTFTVDSTGTTVPGNLVVTRATFFGMGRIGPDTDLFSATQFVMGVPYGTSGNITKPAWGRSTNRFARTMTYTVNGVGNFTALTSTVDTFVRDGPQIRSTGTITFQTRSGGVDWQGTWSTTYQQRFVVGRKSDDTAAGSLNKSVDVQRVSLVYTCQRAYTPGAVGSGVTGPSNFDLLTVANLDNVFTSNVTEAAGNKIALFTSPVATGVVTAYVASQDLTAFPVAGTIIGSHGNSVGMGVLVNSIALAGFGSQAPQATWIADSSGFARLQLRNLVTSSVIPQSATITLDFWLVDGKTVNATTVGDNLLPDEIVAFLQSLAVVPAVTTRASEVGAPSLSATVLAASTRAVAGVRWFQDNTVAKTTVAGNGAYQYNVKTAVVGTTDDDDGNYGEAHKLHGLCLRYLRTHDASLIALIETQVQFHIDIEAAAVAAYGSFWSGSAPYWYWPSATSSGATYTAEGDDSTGNVDPTFNGGVTGPITYTRGQVRRKTSSDQMHMVAHALYAYLVLLGGETTITANTTLRTNALALLGRMRDFEIARFSASVRVCGNVYALATGATPSVANGISDTLLNTSSVAALANPYYGTFFGTWNVSNGTGAVPAPSANAAIDNFFRAVYAPDSVASGVRRYMRGQAMDMEMLDAGRHDVVWSANPTSQGVLGTYPAGWSWRSQLSSNTTIYQSPRTSASNNGFSTDLHYLRETVGAGFDHLSGRAAQRLCVLCLLALLDRTTTVPIEMNGASVLREIPIVTACDDAARTLATFLPEPTTGAQRYSVAGHFGESATYDPQIVDSAYTGYWLMATELWFMVRDRAKSDTYYRIAGV